MKMHPITGTRADKVRSPVRTGGSTGRVGSYGMTRDGGTRKHHGADYLCQFGHPICAALDGTVMRAGEEIPRAGVVQDGRKGYGYRVYLRHKVTGEGRKLETRYAHLGVIFVRDEQFVRAGEVIGLAGRSGNVDDDCPTHLHFEVRINNNATDPETWLR